MSVKILLPEKKVVVYIVHSPFVKEKQTSQESMLKEAVHLKKIERLLRFAKRYGLPIFWEQYDYTDKAEVNRLLEETGIDREKVHLIDGNDEKKLVPQLRELGERERIFPRRFLFAGHFKEKCSTYSAESLRKAFPSADLVMLKGDFNYSSFAFLLRSYKPIIEGVPKTLRREERRIAIILQPGSVRALFEGEKRFSKTLRKADKVRRKPLSRKLLR